MSDSRRSQLQLWTLGILTTLSVGVFDNNKNDVTEKFVEKKYKSKKITTLDHGGGYRWFE